MNLEFFLILIILFFAILYVYRTIKKSAIHGECGNCTGNCQNCSTYNEEYIKNLKKKLIYICSKRAVLENEILLNNFVKNYALKNYSPYEIYKLTEFLDKTDDITLLEYILKKRKVPNRFQKFINDIIQSQGSKFNYLS